MTGEITFSNGGYIFIIAAVVCYFIGCFNFAVLIAHKRNKDIYKQGSGNPGTMNMTRTFGWKVGALNFLLDVLKGGLPVLAGYFIFRNSYFLVGDVKILASDFARYFFGICVIVGHIAPVTLKFRGGKGIASSVGVFVFALPCENPWFTFAALGFGAGIILYIVLSEMGSMGSLMAVAGYSVWQSALFVVKYSGNLLNGWVIALFMLILAINLLTWIAHFKNIGRLLAGEERRTQVIKKKGRQ